ncbi:MAG: nuclear transport factor 2 family protein [Saprospiraceae bacterium]
MKSPVLIFLFCFFISIGLAQKSRPSNEKKFIAEIMSVERSFGEDLRAKGVAYAFEYYAADEAVIRRGNDSLITGRKGIRHFYDQEQFREAKAWWTPDHIDVSRDGTLASSYGHYRWEFREPDGSIREYSGIFHTIWKRQKDGSWKYVWD